MWLSSNIDLTYFSWLWTFPEYYQLNSEFSRNQGSFDEPIFTANEIFQWEVFIFTHRSVLRTLSNIKDGVFYKKELYRPRELFLLPELFLFLFTGLGESTSWAWEMFGRRCLIFKLKFNWTIQENHHQPLKITRKKRSTIFSLMSFPALIYIQIFRCSDYYRTASVAGHLHQKKKTGSWVESYKKWWTVSRWKFVSSKLKITSFHVVLCKLF